MGGRTQKSITKGVQVSNDVAQLWSVKDTNIHTVLLKTKTEEI